MCVLHISTFIRINVNSIFKQRVSKNVRFVYEKWSTHIKKSTHILEKGKKKKDTYKGKPMKFNRENT